MKAMVLAAGEGTRLRPLTLALPKPIVPIANIPLIARTLRLLAGQGITEVAVNLYHRAEMIRGTLHDGAEKSALYRLSP
jgi:NDP-sugar pyrophosphorylase family protein